MYYSKILPIERAGVKLDCFDLRHLLFQMTGNWKQGNFADVTAVAKKKSVDVLIKFFPHCQGEVWGDDRNDYEKEN